MKSVGGQRKHTEDARQPGFPADEQHQTVVEAPA
jgi:hypothetical protein